MPNCPVCGKEVQSTTTYCPTCGTSLKQTSPGSSAQSGTYSPNYYSPQPGTGMPATGQPPHSHRKYILALIIVGLIGLIVGGLVTSEITGNLSSGVFPDKSYQVYLPILSSGSYAVTIQWTNVTAGAGSFYSCTPNPSTFSSFSQNATQNFSC